MRYVAPSAKEPVYVVVAAATDIGATAAANAAITSETKSFLPIPASPRRPPVVSGESSAPSLGDFPENSGGLGVDGRSLRSRLGQVEAVPVRVLAVDVDDPLQPRLLEQACGDARAIARRTMHGNRRVVRDLVRAAGDVGHVHVDGPGDVASHPLVLVAHVDDGHGLRAQHPLRQVLDVHGLKAGQLAPARAPRVHPAIELAGDDVETDAQQLPLRLAVLRLCASSEHERPAARDEPADPGADGAVDADVVAARDV